MSQQRFLMPAEFVNPGQNYAAVVFGPRTIQTASFAKALPEDVHPATTVDEWRSTILPSGMFEVRFPFTSGRIMSVPEVSRLIGAAAEQAGARPTDIGIVGDLADAPGGTLSLALIAGALVGAYLLWRIL